ncbi:MAG: carboxypeptidase regulatory-like domain-containing protein [Nitrospira sp.]|nr:carboxypeptidase regulatory-like domain-containing protein [Nitrospira sp.]
MGVAVWIENNQHKQTTKVDSHGWFYFLNLPKGDYALTIDKQGNGEEVVLSVQLWQFKENKGRREAEVVLDERQEDESLKKAPSTGRKVRIS